MTNGKRSKFLQRPATRLGWWALSLGIAFELMNILSTAIFMRLPESAPLRQTFLPYYGILMILTGLASGVVALIALIKNRERSWLVWLALLPGVMAVVLLAGEFLLPH